jgi:hypothetical protein
MDLFGPVPHRDWAPERFRAEVRQIHPQPGEIQLHAVRQLVEIGLTVKK